ncbi:PPC domain-containing protein [Archangium gephyra]|uniref:PPC domain-containing protein n=1 Tax=Archangium gephyra TaxID=48 RepID=UPI0035D43B7E
MALLAAAALVPWLSEAQTVGQRCETDSQSPQEAEARVEWARRCALLTNVVSASNGFTTIAPLIDYQEVNPSTNPYGVNAFQGDLMGFEVNSTYIYSLFSTTPTSQSMDPYGFWKWNWPATGKRTYPLYPVFSTTYGISDYGNVQLFPHPQLADCRLYSDRSGYNAVGTFYVNLYCDSTSTTLSNGVALTYQSGAGGSVKYYTVKVPEGSVNLTFTASGSSGDVNLYVKNGARPTTGWYDCASTSGTTYEACSLPSASPGTYHVMLVGVSSYSGLSLTARWNKLQNGVTVSNLFAGSAVEKLYTYSVPLNSMYASFTLYGGSGDADIYVRRGSPPTTSVYDCASTLGGSGTYDSCDLNYPSSGTYYILVRGFTAYSGVSLVASHEIDSGGCLAASQAEELSSEEGAPLRIICP